MAIYDLQSLRSAAERAGFKGTDEELILDYSKRTGISPSEVAYTLGAETGGKWGNRLSASIDNYQANLYGLGEAATGSDWLRRQRESNEAAAGLRRELARSQGAVMSYKDVDSFGGGLDYLGGLAVDSLPYAGEALLGGWGAARLAGRGLQGAIQAGRAADASADAVRAGQVAERALATRSTLGGVAASYPSAVGDILSNQREASHDGEVNLLAAAVGGIPYAALNAFGVEGALARRSLARGVGEGGALRRLGRSIGTTAVVEGAGETGQEMINQRFGRMAVDPNAGFFDADALDRYVESFVGGAALGGAFGSVGGWRRSQEYLDQDRLQAATSREQAAIELANKQRELDLLNRRPDFDLQPGDLTYSGQPQLGDVGGADWGQGGIAGTQGELFNPNGTPTYGANSDSTPMLEVDDVRSRLGTPTSLDPQIVGSLAGVQPAPTAAQRSARAADVQAAISEPGQRYVDADGIERVGTRGMDYERQLGILEQVQRKAADDRAADDRARAIVGTGAGKKAVDLARRLQVLEDSGAITEDQLIEQAALLTNSKFGPVTKFLEGAEARASQRPVVSGAPGGAGGPVAGQGDQSGRGAGAARPVAGSRPAGQAVSAPVVSTSRVENPPVAAAQPVGAVGGEPAALTLAQRLEARGVDLDASVEVKTAGGVATTVSRRTLLDNIGNADETDRVILAAVMARNTGRTLNLDQIGVLVGRELNRAPISGQAVKKRLAKYGIDESTINKMAAVDALTVASEELGPDLAEAGFRTEDSIGDAANDGILDDGATAGQKRLAKQADAILKAAEGTKADRDNAAVDEALRPAISDGERAVAERRSSEELRRQLERDIQDPASAAAVFEAARDWDEGKLDNSPSFADLPSGVKYTFTVEHRELAKDDAPWSDFERLIRDYEKDLADGLLTDTPTQRAVDALPRNRAGQDGLARADQGDGQPRAVAGQVRGGSEGAVEAPDIVVGDGTQAQGVKVERERSASKAVEPKDYSYLGDATVEEDVEVDGVRGKFKLSAADEFRRLDKLESDLMSIIACVRGK